MTRPTHHRFWKTRRAPDSPPPHGVPHGPEVSQLQEATLNATMTLWHRKAPFNHLGGWNTLKTVVRKGIGHQQAHKVGRQKSNCRKVAESCGKSPPSIPPPLAHPCGPALGA